MPAETKFYRQEVVALEARAIQKRAKVDTLAEQRIVHAALADQHEDNLRVLEQTSTVLNAMERAWRRGFEEALTAMVSRGLTLVLGEPTEFKIASKLRGASPTLEFTLVQNGIETDVMEAKGGTVVNLVNFLLRLAVILSTQPPLRKVLILDEAFAHVSAEYVPALAALIRELCDETGVQVILVTHEPAYGDVADVVYEVSQTKGKSRYVRLKERRDE